MLTLSSCWDFWGSTHLSFFKVLLFHCVVLRGFTLECSEALMEDFEIIPCLQVYVRCSWSCSGVFLCQGVMSYFSIVYHQEMLGNLNFSKSLLLFAYPYFLYLLSLFLHFIVCCKKKPGAPPTKKSLPGNLLGWWPSSWGIFFIFRFTAINHIAKLSANTQGSLSSCFQEHFLHFILRLSPWASHGPVDVQCLGLWDCFD